MILTKLLSKQCFCLFILTFYSVIQSAGAACVAGSITMRAPLYTVTIDASRLLTYQRQIGTVAKRAVLRSDCVGYTTYTISGTSGLAYANGTQLVVLGKNDFTSLTPRALFLTVNNGSIDSTITASGAQTGINSDPFSIYFGSSMVMRVKQPWR
jgi:hypothetical protein